MNTRSVLFALLGSAIICLTMGQVSQAGVKRVFVSTNGNDSSPCSAIQPCRTFSQALATVDPGGEVVVQNSGGYSPGFTISQSVTIDAGGVDASVLSTGSGDLCTISAGSGDRVVLRGISFHGAGVGTNAINAMQVGSLYVEHCSITEFTHDGVLMANGGNLWVTDTDIRGCGVDGVHIDSNAVAASLVAENSRFAEMGNGGVIVRSASSLPAVGLVTHCTASRCHVGIGVNVAATGTASGAVTNSRLLGNHDGLEAVLETGSSGNALVHVAYSTITGGAHWAIRIDNGGSGQFYVVGTNPGTNHIFGNSADLDFTPPGSPTNLQ